MRTAFAVFALMGVVSSAHAATELEVALNVAKVNLDSSVGEMNDALVGAQNACIGISTELNRLKALAGAGTGVAVLGTTGATAATVAGAMKGQADAAAMELTPWKAEWKKLNDAGAADAWKDVTVSQKRGFMDCMSIMVQSTDVKPWGGYDLQKYRQNTTPGTGGHKMGDVRTGTLAASAALNVVGATISGIDTKRSGDLSERVAACLAATRELNNAWGQVRIHKITYESLVRQHSTEFIEDSALVNDLARVETIVRVCDEWSTVNMSKIDTRAAGALTSSIVGATTGTVGTITSAVANTSDVHLSGTNKEKKLNTASNILAGGTAVAGTAATIFNATQISAIKRASTVADACEGALK